MPRPICFMIMPYGTKLSGAPAGSGAPNQIDFDRLWETALRPAIDEAGYEPVRANEDIGALIIVEMIERLAMSDLVVADVSIPNGNVYYEVGIRHAAQKRGCILTAADWAKPLFDIAQMRHVRYPLPEQSVSKETADAIIAIVKEAIPKLADGESPFFQVLPNHPNYDERRATSFRSALEDLSRFQSDVIAARKASGDDRKRRALELRDRLHAGEPMRTVVALEILYMLRDCTDWETTLQFIDGMPEALRDSALVKEQRALALSKIGKIDDAIGALTQLIESAGGTSERYGLLGGRYKAKWRLTKTASDLSLSIKAYEDGMKADLNDYFPSCNLARLYRTRNRKGDEDKARIAAAVTATACERARNLRAGDEWLKATLLGAAFDAGDVGKADELSYEVEDEGPAAWKLDTTVKDCRTAAELCEEPKRGELLAIVERLEQLLSR